MNVDLQEAAARRASRARACTSPGTSPSRASANLTERAPAHARRGVRAPRRYQPGRRRRCKENAPAFTVTKRRGRSTDEPGVAKRINGHVPGAVLPGQRRDCEPGGEFDFESNRWSNLPVRSPGRASSTAPFYCNVPTAAERVPQAAASVQYGHGLLGVGRARSIDREPDIQRHGRGAQHDVLRDGLDRLQQRRERPVRDGGPARTSSLFPSFVDRMQQGFLDQIFLGRLMLHEKGFKSHAGLPTGRPADLRQRRRCSTTRNSQGGIHGRRPDGAGARLPERRPRRPGDQLLDPAARAASTSTSYAVIMYEAVSERARAAARPRPDADAVGPRRGQRLRTSHSR